MHPKFATLTEQEQVKVLKQAFMMLKTDSFFIAMSEESDEATAMISAIGTATNKHLQSVFHERLGDRDL